MRAFRQSYPNIQVELQVDLSTFIEDRLADGRLDLAVQTGPFTSKMSGDIALGNAAYIWVATPELAAQIGQTPSLQTLFQRQVLTHAKHTQAGLWLHDMAHKHGLNTYQIVHSSALSACLPMARESLGVALLPAALVAPDITAGLLQKIDITCLPKALAFHARYNATSAPRFVAQAALCARDVMKLGSDIP
jgi:DNA-binding transcriptional LysR family regulator